MSILPKRWNIAPLAPMEFVQQCQGLSPRLAQALYNRGLTDSQEALRFLYANNLEVNPFVMKDMSKAVSRIRQAIKQQEQVVVYGDFDADGVTSTTLLVQVLRSLGATVQPYIPHRVDEGYGLNSPALESLREHGADLVITVDCGIRSVQEVEHASKIGLDIVITDHHSIGPEIPNAIAVVNPQQVDCKGESALAGVGVAYMLAVALLRVEKAQNHAAPLDEDVLLDLVAIGTVADIMPLNVTLNRMLVRRGLQMLNRAKRVGLRTLYEVAGLKPGDLQATSIGFGIGPRINAAGRLESAMTAYQLLMEQDPIKARELAQELQNLNIRRRALTDESQALIEERLTAIPKDELTLIFDGDESLPSGIVGLVAGKLVQEYYRPAVILEYGDNESRASCRSIPEFHVTDALDSCADLLVRHGGHAMAAGFTVRNENIPALRDHLLAKAQHVFDGLELSPTLDIDAELEMHELTEGLVQDMALLEPTGHKNPTPTFVTKQMKILDARKVGSDGNHLKLKLGKDRRSVDAIAFRFGDLYEDLTEYVDVAYNLEMNEWNNRRSLQLMVQDIHLNPI